MVASLNKPFPICTQQNSGGGGVAVDPERNPGQGCDEVTRKVGLQQVEPQRSFQVDLGFQARHLTCRCEIRNTMYRNLKKVISKEI